MTRQPQLLVVEDNADQWALMDWVLRRQLPEVEPVWKSTSEAALTYLEMRQETGQKLPALILLDLYLPKREQGWTLLQILKAHYLYRTIPVIILSYSNQREDIEEAYSLRSNAYMVKPTSAEGWLVEFDRFRNYWWDAVTLLS